MDFRPKMLICGGSGVPARPTGTMPAFREIADKCGALLMMDMAHISGLVAAEERRSPSTTATSSPPPRTSPFADLRSGMIFFRRGPRPSKKGEPEGQTYDYESRERGGVPRRCRAVLTTTRSVRWAVALKHAAARVQGVLQAGQGGRAALAAALMKERVQARHRRHRETWCCGILRACGLTGTKMETICDMLHITLNKNAVFGDASGARARERRRRVDRARRCAADSRIENQRGAADDARPTQLALEVQQSSRRRRRKMVSSRGSRDRVSARVGRHRGGASRRRVHPRVRRRLARDDDATRIDPTQRRYGGLGCAIRAWMNSLIHRRNGAPQTPEGTIERERSCARSRRRKNASCTDFYRSAASGDVPSTRGNADDGDDSRRRGASTHAEVRRAPRSRVLLDDVAFEDRGGSRKSRVYLRRRARRSWGSRFLDRSRARLHRCLLPGVCQRGDAHAHGQIGVDARKWTRPGRPTVRRRPNRRGGGLNGVHVRAGESIPASPARRRRRRGRCTLSRRTASSGFTTRWRVWTRFARPAPRRRTRLVSSRRGAPRVIQRGSASVHSGTRAPRPRCAGTNHLRVAHRARHAVRVRARSSLEARARTGSRVRRTPSCSRARYRRCVVPDVYGERIDRVGATSASRPSTASRTRAIPAVQGEPSIAQRHVGDALTRAQVRRRRGSIRAAIAAVSTPFNANAANDAAYIAGREPLSRCKYVVSTMTDAREDDDSSSSPAARTRRGRGERTSREMCPLPFPADSAPPRSTGSSHSAKRRRRRCARARAFTLERRARPLRRAPSWAAESLRFRVHRRL